MRLCACGCGEEISERAVAYRKGHGKRLPQEVENKFIRLFNGGYSASKVGRECGYETTTVTRVLKRNGIKMSDGKGENHSGWKGGKVVKGGYPATHNPDHPRASRIGYVYDHVLEMEKNIGRIPDRNEPIHHIDFDKANSNIENLHLCESVSEHMKIHYSLESLAREMFKQGTIVFEDGEYKHKP